MPEMRETRTVGVGLLGRPKLRRWPILGANLDKAPEATGLQLARITHEPCIQRDRPSPLLAIADDPRPVTADLTQDIYLLLFERGKLV